MRLGMTLRDKIRLAREGSAVERCHVHPHQMRYSVGHHSLDLITLIVFTWQHAHEGDLPRSELLVAAAFHDIPERVSGDVPQPIKMLLGDKLHQLDGRVLDALNVNTKLTSEEAAWLECADRLELYLWAIEEAHQRGNVYFSLWVEDYDHHFKEQPPHPVFQSVMTQAKLCGGRKLTFEFLKGIAGL